MLDFPSLWLSDPHWLGMDPTARGFHAQLVLLALRQGGRLPDDDALWRQWLGLPEPGESPSTSAPEAVLTSLAILDASQGRAPAGEYRQALDYYWVHRWAPMLKKAWTPAGPGECSCALVQQLLQQTPGCQVATPPPPAMEPIIEKPAAKPKRTKKKPKANSALTVAGVNWDSLVSSSLLHGDGLRGLRPLSEKLVDLDQIKARWHVPVSRSSRLHLWTIGLAVLGPIEDQGKNRAFLANQISRYGESKVLAAVGQISGRAIPPADPRSFLLGILRKETEGTAAAQRARETRAGIPL